MASQPPLSGKITFVENHLSPLLAGEYTIGVHHHVANTDEGAPSDVAFSENYSNTRQFAVVAPRFSINPATIYNVFPPKEGRGEYDNVLPHVVLTRAALPWLRTPDGSDAGRPWLALLLFEQTELDAAAKAGRPVEVPGTQPVGNLQRGSYTTKDGATATSDLPADTVSYPGLDATKPAGEDGLDFGQHWADPCRLIDIPIDLYNAIVPAYGTGPAGRGDLRYLAHSRLVETNAVKTERGGAGQDEFSVVVSNRMPAPNTRCVAHLVSLENMQAEGAAYLPTVDEAADYQPGKFPAGTKFVRLVSLHSWAFTSIDPKETFTRYLENLDVDTLRIPSASTNPDVAVPLALGYTALNHQTRQGDRTVSWYRGPFVPIDAPQLFEPEPDPDTVTEPLRSADEALRYNPATGMLDVSYAAAWKLGQLLGVSNKAYSQALYNWKRVNTQKTILAVERDLLRQQTGEALFALAGDNHDTRALHEAAAALLAGPLKPHLKPQ